MAEPAYQPQPTGDPIIIHGPNGVTTQLEFITPEMARLILEKQNTLNRRMRAMIFDPYTRDMEEGRFYYTHQGIAYDTDEVLVDGQHRLQAIVDSQPSRALPDRMVLVGHEWVSATTIATLRRLLASFALVSTLKLRPSEVMEKLTLHRDALGFSEDCFPVTVRGITLAAVRAVIARAFYTANLDMVRQFTAVLNSGVMTYQQDQPAIVLRNNLLMTPSNSRGEGQMLVVYTKTQRAVVAFLDRKGLTRL